MHHARNSVSEIQLPLFTHQTVLCIATKLPWPVTITLPIWKKVVNCPEVTGPPTITTVTRAWSCSTTWAQRCSEGIRLKDQERHAESNTNRVLYTLLCMTDTLVQLQNSNSKRFEVSSSKLATHMEETSVPVSKISAYFRCLVLGERFQPGPCQSGISAKWCKM